MYAQAPIPVYTCRNFRGVLPDLFFHPSCCVNLLSLPTALQTPTTAYPNGYLGEMCFTKQPACEQYLDAQSGTTTVSGTCGLVRTISIVIIVVPIFLVVLIACCVALCIWCCCCRKKKAVGP